MKSLILAALITSGVGFSTPQNSNEGTYYQDVTITETYEYETNEVNSIEDLVVGNIYHLNIFSFNSTRDNRISFTKWYNLEINTTPSIVETTSQTAFNLAPYFSLNVNYVAFWQYKTPNKVIGLSNILCECDIVFDSIENFNDFNVSYTISESNYLGEKTITVEPKEFNGFYTMIDNFLHERIFSGGILDTTQITILGQQMTMGQWLSSTTSIVLCCLIIIVLVLLLKYIFKYVGGMFIWKS